MGDRVPKYIIISPVKDEQAYVGETLRSVAGQTVIPWKWIIVDDGSSDETSNIVSRFAKEHGWVRVINSQKRNERQPGAPVIRAFNLGYELIKHEPYDFIVKLDCDLRFDADYFESILTRFSKNPRLGIASGIYLEDRGKGWVPVEMPDYHAAGASKVIRKECFEQIGGFVAEKSWDTVDEIRAQVNGWETQHFKDLVFYHLKNEGSGIGQLRTAVMLGEVSYLTGWSKAFFLAKTARRLFFGQPFVLGSIMMLFGYLRALILRKQRLVSDDEAKHYRRLLVARMARRFGFNERRN